MVLTPADRPRRSGAPAGGWRAGGDQRAPSWRWAHEIPIAHELVAGRGSAVDIALEPTGMLPAATAAFVRGQEADVIEDLHSTNGTFVNGQRLNGSRTLAQGDTITIGQTQFAYERGA